MSEIMQPPQAPGDPIIPAVTEKVFNPHYPYPHDYSDPGRRVNQPGFYGGPAESYGGENHPGYHDARGRIHGSGETSDAG